MSAMMDVDAAPRAPIVKLNENASRLFRVWKVIHNMLTKRGYAVVNEDRNMTAEEFVARFSAHPDRGAMTILVSHVSELTESGKEKKLIVYFPEDEKVGVKPIKTYTDQMRENEITASILVLRQGITPFAKQAVQVSHSVRRRAL